MRAIQPLRRGLGGASGSPRDFLLLAGEGLGGNGPLESIARLQALPVGGDVGPEIFGKPNVFGEPECVTDDDISRGEAIGDERLRLARRSAPRSGSGRRDAGSGRRA